MNIVSMPTKPRATLCDLQDELNALIKDPRFDDITVIEIIGLFEMFKWEWLYALPEREDL